MQCVCSPFASEAETQRSGIGPAPPDPSRELATFNPMTRLAKADKIDVIGGQAHQQDPRVGQHFALPKQNCDERRGAHAKPQGHIGTLAARDLIWV